MNEYSEKLKDPRWQKKRLKIFNRDNFTCVECGDTETTLHIHHKEYKDSEIWDYPNESLITLCENCHRKKHPTIIDILTNLLKDVGAYSKMIESGVK